MIYKEKKIHCGDYLEIDIVPAFRINKINDIKKTKKEMNIEKVKILNDKKAKRKLHQIVLNNFTNNDFHLSLTYADEFLPASEDEANKNIINYIRRIKNKLKKVGKEKQLKYIIVTEAKGKEEQEVRIHHHLIINNVLSRDEYEELWSKGKGKNKKAIGYANADRLKFNNDGLKELINYITKNASNKHSKKWTGSQNLKRPVIEKKGISLSHRKIDTFKSSIEEREYWEGKYKGYQFVKAEIKYNQYIGRYYIYLNMIRR